MLGYSEYLARLSRQRPAVERLRSEAAAKGDWATVSNSNKLLMAWAAQIPTND